MQDRCPPCRTVNGTIVSVGTIAYRPLDTPPTEKSEHGVGGPHYNLYKANQAPRNSPQPCKCFWQRVGAVPALELPPAAIPIEPFAERARRRSNAMKYPDGQEVRLGDQVRLGENDGGVVVASIDTDEYGDG